MGFKEEPVPRHSDSKIGARHSRSDRRRPRGDRRRRGRRGLAQIKKNPHVKTPKAVVKKVKEAKHKVKKAKAESKDAKPKAKDAKQKTKDAKLKTKKHKKDGAAHGGIELIQKAEKAKAVKKKEAAIQKFLAELKHSEMKKKSES